jgi:hypothetical protein
MRQQRLGGGRQILLLAYPVQHGQRVGLAGRQFQDAQTELVRFIPRVLLQRLPRPLDDWREGPRRALRRQCRRIELAAADGAQPAAASAPSLGAAHYLTSQPPPLTAPPPIAGGFGNRPGALPVRAAGSSMAYAAHVERDYRTFQNTTRRGEFRPR